MDEIKLKKWREAFESRMPSVQIEFDAFLNANTLQEMYTLKVDDTTQNLSLEIKQHMPKEIEDRLKEILFATQPEDSI